ncbi:MAG: cytochrome C oxidase subunit IV family protein [Gemmatimonadota bacterium]|nr:cytochrome C oxidase subunit IV family protein [Gemmatimonadota bacterium]
MHAPAHAHAADAAHDHPSTGLYFKIGLVLFVLTALEVGAYEVAHADNATSLTSAVAAVLIPVLLVLSAAKFALVAMFYMHLKTDRHILTGVFVFSLIIAAVVIVALIVLMAYHLEFSRSLFPGAS